ncbi:MAG: type II secretion system F family protein [Candidatus Moranbacteria bacterium]|nr:type II secretion system F family protein [Candidatus Moranbacteria bacterium]
MFLNRKTKSAKGGQIQKNLKKKKTKKRKFSRILAMNIGKEKDYFVENLSMLMNSGINVLPALKIIKKEVRSKSLKKLIDFVSDDIESGESISKALINTRIFPDHTISLIKVGEETGRLSENLKVIAIQEKKNIIFKSKIQSAMMYPVLVFLLSAVIGTGIAWFILPRLATVFSRLSIELPLITKGLIVLGIFLGDYGKIVIPSFLVGSALIFYFIFYFSKTKFIGQAILLILPGVKRLIIETELARFGFLLGTLLKAGMPLVPALNSLAQATSFKKYRKLYSHLKEKIENGDSFQASFDSYKKSYKLIPHTIQQMITSGGQSGFLSETLESIGKTYEEKTETTTKNLTILLEPIMLVFVWVGVVAVALAVILPIYSLIGGLNEPKEIKAPSFSEESLIIETVIEDEEEIVEEPLQELEILSTETGFLNIRKEASLEGGIIGKVFPGEVFDYVRESDGWYEIILDESISTDEIVGEADNEESEKQLGWIYGKYVEVSSAEETTEVEALKDEEDSEETNQEEETNN